MDLKCNLIDISVKIVYHCIGKDKFVKSKLMYQLIRKFGVVRDCEM